jgi:hypothetical protein
MEILFFPFSHVSETQQITLTAFFPQFVFLPLAPDLTQDPQMVPLMKHGTAVPVFSSETRLAQVSSQVSAWMNWASLHQGNEHNLKNLIRDNPYLTDHLGPAAIGSELRARMAGTPQNCQDDSKQADPLLFSLIAKLTDAENETIDQAMAGLEKKRAGLFSELRGDSDPLSSKAIQSQKPDPGAVMTLERIRSWAACARETHLFSALTPRAFVTTSSAVFDQVAANGIRVINALDIDGIKVHEDGCVHQPDWHSRVLTLLSSLAAGPVDVSQARNMLAVMDDSCARTGRIQAQMVEGPDLEKKLNLPGTRLLICRVTLKP